MYNLYHGFFSIKRDELKKGVFIKTPVLEGEIVKKSFFGKSVFTAYFNLTGVFLLMLLIILAGIILLTIWLTRKYLKKRRKAKK